MTKKQVTDPIDEVLNKYLAAAIDFGNTQRIPDYKAGNKFATILQRLGKVLREDEEGQKLLSPLMQHKDSYVRLWAAKDCLFFDQNTATTVLDEIEKTPGLLGTTARATLSEWKAGRLFSEK